MPTPAQEGSPALEVDKMSLFIVFLPLPRWVPDPRNYQSVVIFIPRPRSYQSMQIYRVPSLAQVRALSGQLTCVGSTPVYFFSTHTCRTGSRRANSAATHRRPKICSGLRRPSTTGPPTHAAQPQKAQQVANLRTRPGGNHTHFGGWPSVSG